MTYIEHPFHPAGYQQVQLTEFVANLTVPLDAVRVIIQPEGQNIRLRDDGVNPTVSTGLQIANGATLLLETDSDDVRIISEAYTANAESAFCVVNSAAVNSDLTFTSVDTGPEWNDYDFEIIEDAATGVNSAATLNSNAANSDLTFTANEQNSNFNGYDFTVALDAANEANAAVTLNSNAVNSDVTFTAAAVGSTWNNYSFEIVLNANAGVNAAATLDSVGVNSDVTFTANAEGVAWNGYSFTTVADANAGVNASAVLNSNAANSDITFTANAVGSAWNGYSFTTVADAYQGARATAIIDSAAVNSDLTFVALDEGVEWNDFTFETVADVNAGANAEATINSAAANSDLVFTSPAKDDIYNDANFVLVANATESVTYDANSDVFTIHLDTANSANASAAKTNFDANIAANPGWPQWTCAVEGDGSGVPDETFGVAAGGIDEVTAGVVFAANAFTIHVGGAATAADVVTLWEDANAPADCANWSVADIGDGSGAVDEILAISIGGADPIDPYIEYANAAFTIHIYPVVTLASEVVTLWGDVNSPAECADWLIADEGNGAGQVDAVTDTSALGVDVVNPYIEFANSAFTLHILPTTIGSEVVTLWGDVNAPANCADWLIADEGDGTGVVDAVTVNSANGVDQLDPYIEFAVNAFTIHMLPAATANDVVVLWGDVNAPANCADWAIAGEGDATGAVDAISDLSANGVDQLDPYIEFAANAFIIHMFPTQTGAEVVTLWGDVNSPTECADWLIADEGDGTGAVDDTVTDTSANGVTPIAPYVEYANSAFTIHTIPATTIGSEVVTLWSDVNSPTECADWTCVDEGDGTGIVDAGTETTANGADAVGAKVNLTWYRE